MKSGKDILLGGRQQKSGQDQNDILFPPEFKKVSRRQFQIIYNPLNSKFNLICLSASNPTCIFVERQPIQLSEKMIIELPNSNILYIDKISTKNKKMLNHPHKDLTNTSQTITLKFHTTTNNHDDQFMFNQQNLNQIQKNFYLNNLKCEEHSIKQVISANVAQDDGATVYTNYEYSHHPYISSNQANEALTDNFV